MATAPNHCGAATGVTAVGHDLADAVSLDLDPPGSPDRRGICQLEIQKLLKGKDTIEANQCCTRLE